MMDLTDDTISVVQQFITWKLDEEAPGLDSPWDQNWFLSECSG